MKTEGERAKEIAEILNQELGTTYSFLHPLVQRLVKWAEQEIDEAEKAEHDSHDPRNNYDVSEGN